MREPTSDLGKAPRPTPRDHHSFPYILASQDNGTLYVGVTSDLGRRSTGHVEGAGSKSTKRYNVTRMVRYEEYQEIERAIAREKAIKKWRRDWKLDLVEGMNPMWEDSGTRFGD